MLQWETMPGMRFKILVGDDDPTVVAIVKAFLQNIHTVVSCRDGNELLVKAREAEPDLILLDVVFGSMDGFRLAADLRARRETSEIPIIMISGSKMTTADMVEGLGRGADDYLLKPLDRSLLLAKIDALMRRSVPPKEFKKVLTACGLKVDLDERRVELKGREVVLTRKEFDLLTAFLQKPGRVLTPQHLLESVWGYDLETYNDTRTVQVHVSRLKSKLGPEFAKRLHSVIGVGYRLD